MTEGLLDQNQTDRSRDKIDSLKNQLEDEKEKLGQIRHHQQRKKELERIRKSHERDQQTEGTSSKKLVSVRDQRGRVVGWIQSVGRDRVNILDPRGRVVGRFINGQTYNNRGNVVGRGDQLLRVLGRTTKT